MNIYEAGQIIWTYMYYTNKKNEGKIRPSLVLGYNGDKVVLAEITSFRDLRPFYYRDVYYGKKKKVYDLWYGDVIIENWKDIKGLSTSSAIRTQTIIQVHTSNLNVESIGGIVSKETMDEVYRFLSAIESMYFEIPYFFAQWCVRYQPKYFDYLNIDSFCKNIKDLHEGVELNSLDVAVIVLNMCLKLNMDCCLSAFRWNKGKESKFHFYCIWKDASRYVEKSSRNKVRYFSIHCMYDGYTIVIMDSISKSFKEATHRAADKYCKETNLEYKNMKEYYYKTDKDELKWICTAGRVYTQQYIVNKVLGSTPQLDATFKP